MVHAAVRGSVTVLVSVAVHSTVAIHVDVAVHVAIAIPGSVASCTSSSFSTLRQMRLFYLFN